MYTHALEKAFKPLVEEINNRVFIEYIIPDWYPLTFHKMVWYSDQKTKLGRVSISCAEFPEPIAVISLGGSEFEIYDASKLEKKYGKLEHHRWDSYDLRMARKKQYEEQIEKEVVSAADPKSLYKVRDKLLLILREIITEVSLENLPIGE